MKKVSNIVQIVSVYIGLILGAGFASGQEIIQFFAGYGKNGLIGILLTGVLFAIGAVAVMEVIFICKIKDNKDFSDKVYGKQLGKVVDFLSIFFMWVLFATMLSAGGAVAQEVFNINKSLGIVIGASICYLVFLFDAKGVISANVVLTPILVIGGILIGLYTYFGETNEVFAYSFVMVAKKGYIISAVLYVCYNFVTAIRILVELKEKVTSKSIARISGVIGGLCMGFLGLCLALPLVKDYELIKELELPLYEIVGRFGFGIEGVYVFILFSAILATAITNGFVVLKWLERRVKTKFYKLLFTISGVVFAHVSFSYFVGKVYPVFAYIGLLQLVLILVKYFSVRRKHYKP